MTPEQIAWRAAHHVPWQQQIGEGGPLEWAAVAGYLLAGALCVLAARRLAAVANARAERRLWHAIAGALLLLGVNKQLDLQTLLFDAGREFALTYGWYGARRVVQWAAFGAGAIVVVLSALWLLPTIWRQGATMRTACAGMALIGLYVALRAAKFQHVLWDTPGFNGPVWLPALELVGIVAVAGAAWWRWRRIG